MIIAVLNIAFLLFLAFFIWRREQSPHKNFFWPALTVKLAAGIVLGLLYKYYYADAADTFDFFRQSVPYVLRAEENFTSYLKFLWHYDDILNPRVIFFTKMLSVVNLLTNNNYWISSLYFSFASFAGAWWLTKRVVQLIPGSSGVAAISFLFFPSVVFWSSGIVKESLAMAALFYLASVFILLWMRRQVSLQEWLLLLLSVWVLWSLKYYYMAVFFPVAFAAISTRFILSHVKFQSLGAKLFIWLMVFSAPVIGVLFLKPNFHPDELFNVIVTNYTFSVENSDPEKVIHYNHLEPTITSLLLNAPWAAVSGLFRPFIFEASTFFQIVISTENLLMLVLFVTAMWRIRKMIDSPNRLITLSLLMYILSLSAFLALSAPNFGTLVRYRVGFYPFFVFLMLNGNILLEKLNHLLQRSSLNFVRKGS